MTDLAIRNRKLSVVLFALLLLGSAVVWVRLTGLPYRGSEQTLENLGAEVTIRWDRWGVPHLDAESEADLARALGWVHANDRITQMEIGRRAGRGLLSQAFGEDFVDADVYLRTLRLAETADRIYRNADPKSRLWVDAYAEGVNAWLSARDGRLPPELRLLGIEPEPWQPRDGYLFALLMSVDLSFWDDRPEEERFLWLRHFGPEGVRALLGDPDLHVPEEIAALAASQETPAVPPEDGGDDTPEPELDPADEDVALGSNNWAVSGARAAGGAPMVANDPHLDLGLPPVWYQVHLRSPGFEAQGMTLPGAPGVVIGRGSQVAWALTNLMLDDHDLFFESLDAEGERYLRDGEWRPLETEDVRIPLRDGGERRVTLRRTDRGPLLEADEELGLPPRSLAWTTHAPSHDPMLAFYRLAQVSTPPQAFEATSSYVAPAQNLVLGFASGEIAYTVLGRIPERRTGDGRLPSPGWDPAYGWDGLRPRRENPVILRPEEELIVTANHDIRPPGYEQPLAAEFFPPFRAERIREILAQSDEWDVPGFAELQTDHRSLFARRVVAAVADEDLDGDAARVASVLAGWDGQMTQRGPAALFVLVQRHLMRAVFGDEQLAAGLEKPIGHRWTLVDVLEGETPWLQSLWDDVSTEAVEGRREIVQRALDAAWAAGRERWGPEVVTWDYGGIHRLTLRHRLDDVPVLGWWLRRGPWKMPGHATTVLAFGARWEDDGRRQYVTYGPSMRWVVDWSDPERAWAVLPGGQSGHPADDHYSDQMRLYLEGELHEAPWSDFAVENATVRTTRLLPPE